MHSKNFSRFPDTFFFMTLPLSELSVFSDHRRHLLLQGQHPQRPPRHQNPQAETQRGFREHAQCRPKQQTMTKTDQRVCTAQVKGTCSTKYT